MPLWSAVDGAYRTELKDIRPLLDFGHSYGRWAEEHYSLLAKQLCATYAALPATESITRETSQGCTTGKAKGAGGSPSRRNCHLATM